MTLTILADLVIVLFSVFTLTHFVELVVDYIAFLPLC